MPDRSGYGPQDTSYRNAENAAFDKKYPPGTKRPRVSGPSRIVGRQRPTRSADAITPDPAVLVEPIESGGSDSGGSNSQYVTPNYEQHVFIALSLSILLVLTSTLGRQKQRSNGLLAPLVNPHQDILKTATGWTVIFVVLLAMARFRGTDKLAAASAWLIFVSVLLINGEQALALVRDTTSTKTVVIPHQVPPNP